MSFYDLDNITNQEYPEFLWYKFEETSGTNVIDSSNNNYTGVCSTGIENLTSTGILGNCFYFNDDGGYQEVMVVSGIPIADIYSISMWVRANDDSADVGGYLCKIYSDGTDIGIYYNSLNNRIDFESANKCNMFNMTSNEWNHIVGIIDSTNDTILCYQNAESTGYINSPEISFSGECTITIGSILSNTNPATRNLYAFDGLIDDFRVYNYALTQAQVAVLYNNGLGSSERLSDIDSSRDIEGSNLIVKLPGLGYQTLNTDKQRNIRIIDLKNKYVDRFDDKDYYKQDE